MLDRHAHRGRPPADPQEEQAQHAEPGGRMPVRRVKPFGPRVREHARPGPLLPPGALDPEHLLQMGADAVLARCDRLEHHLAELLRALSMPAQEAAPPRRHPRLELAEIRGQRHVGDIPPVRHARHRPGVGQKARGPCSQGGLQALRLRRAEAQPVQEDRQSALHDRLHESLERVRIGAEKPGRLVHPSGQRLEPANPQIPGDVQRRDGPDGTSLPRHEDGQLGVMAISFHARRAELVPQEGVAGGIGQRVPLVAEREETRLGGNDLNHGRRSALRCHRSCLPAAAASCAGRSASLVPQAGRRRLSRASPGPPAPRFRWCAARARGR